MSKPRSSVSDYPEHLNPFYEGDRKFSKIGKVKRSSSFGESLRNVLLFKSIRGKKKKETKDPCTTPPQLRRYASGAEALHRQTSPIIYSPIQSSTSPSEPTPLPRSRFSERVSKPIAHSNNNSTVNPFVENTDLTDSNVKHRKKRRAPLPPGSLKADSPSHNTSKWSLTSECTDISTYSDNEVTIDPVAACIANITKEIEKMTEHDNISMNKGTEIGDEQRRFDIPDIIFSSIDATQVEKFECQNHDNSTDANCNVINEPCEKKNNENAEPDVLYHTDAVYNCTESPLNNDEKQLVCTKESCEQLSTVDVLADSITSINLNNEELEENNERLNEADSLTNIINSIEFIESENFVNEISLTLKHHAVENGIVILDKIHKDEVDQESV